MCMWPKWSRPKCFPPPRFMRRQRLCPSCGSTNVRPSHRKGVLERAILPLLRLRPYRCEHCDERFCVDIRLTRAYKVETRVPAINTETTPPCTRRFVPACEIVLIKRKSVDQN